MDDLDRASELEQAQRDIALAKARAHAPAVAACGACHNCAEPVAAARLFCCTECRDDFEHRQARGGR